MPDVDVEEFLTNGFVCVREAVDPELAVRIADQVWREMNVDPQDASTWKGPVVHHGPGGPDVLAAITSPRLVAAIDATAGVGRWKPRDNMGLFIGRLPTGEDSKDTGWHIDSSFHPRDLPWPDGWDEWSVNVHTRGRALLLLGVWSEIGVDDAPTRVRVGSHVPMARGLAPYGAEGLCGKDLGHALDASADCPEVLATGSPGDVYVAHPFLVHAAQLHRGTTGRLISQPAIHPVETYALDLDGPPVERAIARAIA